MEQEKKIVLSTGNINQKYIVKGIAHVEVKVNEQNVKGGWANFRVSEVYANMNAHFVSAAKHFSGNAVINIIYSNLTLPNFDFVIVGYGTVVEIIDEIN
ncbi:MAG TPA: hypothetical protein PKY81_11035 [bacterium]|nr:hypothetical protein [bacterium]HPN31484.1 hypothetical protein [bacterium]